MVKLVNRPGSAFQTGDKGRNGLEVSRKKWCQVPFSRMDRAYSKDLLAFSDAELKSAWLEALAGQAEGANYDVRGWAHTLYRDQLRGKKVMDLGSGLGYDGLTFAGAGVDVTFVDIVEDNLEVVRRLAGIFGLNNCRCHYMTDFESLDALDRDYDFIWAWGSLLHAPLDFTKVECAKLMEHLKVGGRWLELAYPRTRWEREGRLPFHLWGEKTDGGAPWVDWKDVAKVKAQLAPYQFQLVLAFEFHDSDFNWFALLRVA